MEFVDTKLHEAVRYGDTNLVESALKEDLDPNAIGLYQWGPLHEAASNGDLEILWLLLQYKGDPNAKDHLHGCTPVHYACREGHVECLEALLEMGGRYDVANDDGETGLDMAVGKCRELLDKQRTQELIRVSVKEKLRHDENEDKVLNDKTPETIGKDSVFEDFDEHVSPTPSLKGNLPTAWDAIKVHETSSKPAKDAGTGLLQLSFEYNSHTSIMKIRVWQLEDILLPPAEVASITRVSIRSRLLPDKKGDTKRKTEEAKIEDLEKMKTSIVSVKRKTAKDSFKAIYLPCNFQFTKPLEYKNITKEMVESKTVHIDVNVKQKYSNKSFSVANVQLPLKEAVRKLRKKRYSLHPCINYTMPDNIHSYDPNDLIIVSEGMYSNKTVSNPNLRALSKHSLQVGTDPQRATSDINLQTVRCHSAESIPSVSLSIPDDEQEENEALQAIAIMNDSPRSSHLSHSNPEIHVVEIHEMDTILPGTMNTDLTEVKVETPQRKLSRSSPNIPVLQIEDLEGEAPLKKLNRPTSPPNRLAVPPVSYNRRRHQNSSRIQRELPDVENLKKTPDSLHDRDFKSGVDQEPPRPGKAVPVSPIRKDPNFKDVGEKLKTFSNPSGALHIAKDAPSGLDRKKEAIRSKVREKRNLKSKDGHHGLLRTFSEKEGIDSTVFEHDEASNTSHVEYQEVSELTGSPSKLSSSNFSAVLGQKQEGKPSKHRISRTVLPMSELTLNPSLLPKVETVSETQFGHLSPTKQSTPKKPALKDPTRTHQNPKRLHLSVSGMPETNKMTVAAQDFPQPITRGLMHTELRRPTSPPQRLSSPDDLYTKSRSPSPGSEARVHFQSETEIIEPRYKQTSPARRIRSPVREPESKSPKTPERVEIEMSHLQLDPAFQKEMATPEFKLRMFQRTSRDPHPTEHYIRSKPAGSKQLLDSQEEGMDPFFVPETPTGSPMASTSSGTSQYQGRSVKRPRGVQTGRKTELKQGEMRPVENQSIVRVKQSVL
ncbi:uncharacterized protein LOC119745445 [Patiria miniata]|uniref:Uncharacterized protein n=1 Tax=Patiria miniata TaxID=46514 RepID=A0A914BPU6_PATMI|nr:uncharacterized protein LOC119745445 [Patiria miniata]XP_038077722.1 uncharacterized protein LOC119745445 [Patiria miniata]